MIDISLSSIANQAMSIQLDGRFYEIEVREANGIMSATIIRDGVTVVSNVRITAGTPILPYRYQEEGNFLMITEDNSLPYWDQFGVTQFMIYVSSAELAAYRGA